MNNNSAQADHSPSSLCPWHWGWSAALALIVLVTLAFRYALPVRDGDLWFHMLYGKYFLENGTLIADHTIFSWTPTTNDTIYVTWLPDIFLYLLHKAAGLPGIFAFRYLCMLVPVLGCFLYARKLKITSHPLTWFFCLLAVIMSYTAAFEKPEILSFVFMTLVAWNWWHIRSSGAEAWKNCYLFPIIMLTWVNTHGGFVFGAVFLMLIGLGELLNTWLCPQNVLSPRLRKHLIVALLLAAITPILTPYGYHYPEQLFYELLPTPENSNFNSKIAAYSSTFTFANTFGLAMCADLAIVILLLLFLGNFKKAEWSSLLANLFFAFLYTRFYRTTFYWVPIFLFSSLHLLSHEQVLFDRIRRKRIVHKTFPVMLLAISLYLSGDAYYGAITQPEKYLWMGFGISDANPVSESQYIKKNFPKARIGNTYDQGAYLLWELWPENTVFFDARHFPYRNWSDAFFDFSHGRNVQELVRKYPCDLWCIGLSYYPVAITLLSSGEWKLAFYGRNAIVLVRRDFPLPQGTARLSDDIAEPQNMAAAIDCLSFSCHIRDWRTAKAVLDAMTAGFPYPPNRKSILWATLLYNGMHAFYAGNYQTAMGQFERMLDQPTSIRFMLTSCYHYLSSEAWRRQDDAVALAYARKAWELVPENPYSLYNMGVILWQQERSAPSTGTYGDWGKLFMEFLRTAPHDPDFDAFRPIAQAMLDGKQQGRLPLLIPPEPTLERMKDSGSNP